MSRANVPKFGDWGNDDNVPYTVYFDKARKNKGGKMINPNDPEDNLDMFPNANPPHAKPRMSNEDNNPRKSPVRGQYAGRGNGNEPNYGARGQKPARSSKPSGGSEMSFERSPLHQAAKGTGRGGVSPAWEGRKQDSGHGTPGRSRLRPVTGGDESPDNGAAVPPFGGWENDPSSAENFTEIFQNHRDQKSNGDANVLGTPKHQPYGTPRRQNPNEQKKCCFPWW